MKQFKKTFSIVTGTIIMLIMTNYLTGQTIVNMENPIVNPEEVYSDFHMIITKDSTYISNEDFKISPDEKAGIIKTFDTKINGNIVDYITPKETYKIESSFWDSNNHYYYALDKKGQLFLFIVKWDEVIMMNDKIKIRYFASTSFHTSKTKKLFLHEAQRQ